MKAADRFWLLSGAVLVLVRVVAWMSYAGTPLLRGPVSDSWLYLSLAREWNTSGTWALEAAYHSPLYPYLLGLVLRLSGGSHLPFLVLQNLAGIAASLLVLTWVRRHARAPWLSWAALSLLATSGVWFSHEWRLFPETFAIAAQLFLIEAVTRSLRKRSIAWSLLAGVLMGALVLLRPNYVLAWPVLAGYGLWGARRGRLSPASALAWTLVPLVLIAPFLARNHALEAGWSLAANSGITFHHGNHPDATGGYSRVAGVSADVTRQNVDAAVLAAGGHPRSVSDANRFWWRQGLTYLARHPGDALRLEAQKVLRFMSPIETGGDIPFAFEKRRLPVLHILALTSFTLLLALGIAGLGSLPRFPFPRVLFVSLLAVPFVTCIVFYVMTRYRLPAWPLLLFVAVLGLERTVDALRARHPRDWAFAALLIAGLGATTVGALAPLSPPVVVAGRHNWGVAAQHAGRPDEAIAAYREALRVDPRHRETLENLGQAYLSRGNLDAAAASARELLGAHPGSFVGWHSLATVAVYRQDWGGAAEAARKALALRSEEPATWLILAEASVRLGRREDACEALAHIPKLPERYEHLRRIKEECRK